MDTVHLFNYETANSESVNYGQWYWGVVLEDSRTIYLNADKMVISDTGDLIAISTAKRSKNESGESFRVPTEPKPTLAIAKSHWVSYFAASVLTGEAVSLDNSVKYEEDTKKPRVTSKTK
jgi:hypothetical protein